MGETIRLLIGDDERIKFYAENYDILFFAYLGPNSGKQILGVKGKCRFCRKTEPEVTFKQEAHALPESVGNKHLITNYECDSCNQRFSKFEGELAKALAIYLWAGRVRGRSGVPTIKDRKNNARAEVDTTGNFQVSYAEDGSVQIDEQAKETTMRFQHQRYRPLGLYKALVKAALSVMPESELAPFERTISWLMNDEADVPMFAPAMCQWCFIPGPRPLPEPFICLCRKKKDNSNKAIPYCLLFLATGNIGCQIMVPAVSEYQTGLAYSFQPFPLSQSVDFNGISGLPGRYEEDLSSNELKDAPGALTFSYQNLITIPKKEEDKMAYPPESFEDLQKRVQQKKEADMQGHDEKPTEVDGLLGDLQQEKPPGTNSSTD